MLADSSFSSLDNSLSTPRVDSSDRVRHDALLDQAQALVGVIISLQTCLLITFFTDT
jgi:hypothetical protein